MTTVTGNLLFVSKYYTTLQDRLQAFSLSNLVSYAEGEERQ
jgi:hypothetical protein